MCSPPPTSQAWSAAGPLLSPVRFSCAGWQGHSRFQGQRSLSGQSPYRQLRLQLLQALALRRAVDLGVQDSGSREQAALSPRRGSASSFWTQLRWPGLGSLELFPLQALACQPSSPSLPSGLLNIRFLEPEAWAQCQA